MPHRCSPKPGHFKALVFFTTLQSYIVPWQITDVALEARKQLVGSGVVAQGMQRAELVAATLSGSAPVRQSACRRRRSCTLPGPRWHLLGAAWQFYSAGDTAPPMSSRQRTMRRSPRDVRDLNRLAGRSIRRCAFVAKRFQIRLRSSASSITHLSHLMPTVSSATGCRGHNTSVRKRPMN